MHIVHVNFAKGFRGGERQTLNLIKGLAEQGCRQSLVCRPNGALMQRVQSEVAGVDIMPSAHPLLGHWRALQADLIHVHEARGAYWAWLEHSLRGTPYLTTRRVINAISTGALTRRAYADAAALVGVSADVARRLTAQTGRAVEVVMDSCSPLQADSLAVEEIRRRLGGHPVIGHVGELHDAVKGQSVLIAAFKILSASWPQARLVFVGDGPDRAQLEQLAGGDPRIIFAGYQTNVGAWLGAMDVFAFPSRMEALGSSVLDAMALGVPVVTSTAGGLPELTGADERGLSVAGDAAEAWAAAVGRILGDESLRLRLIETARAFAAQNDVAAMTGRYLDIYRRVVVSVGTGAHPS